MKAISGGLASVIIEGPPATIAVSHSLAVPCACDESVKLIVKNPDDAGAKPVGLKLPASYQSDDVAF